MKIRNGFISNSSSSSFVIFCKEISKADILAGNNKYPIYAEGAGGDGTDFFKLSPEMIEFIKNHQIKNIYGFYEVAALFDAESPKKIPAEVRKDENIQVMSMSVDYYCTEKIEDFMERFGVKEIVTKTIYK